MEASTYNDQTPFYVLWAIIFFFSYNILKVAKLLIVDIKYTKLHPYLARSIWFSFFFQTSSFGSSYSETFFLLFDRLFFSFWWTARRLADVIHNELAESPNWTNLNKRCQFTSRFIYLFNSFIIINNYLLFWDNLKFSNNINKYWSK